QEQASGIDQVNKAIMSMDETTQQNAALVEETTSACQSMKAQAQDLLRQVEVFKVEGTGQGRTVRLERSAGRSMSHQAGGTPTPKQPVGKVPAGVGARNSHDRSAKGGDFEEF
ncbi:MAG: hypothetical protein OEV53_16190, partial [Nitrospira sp.]|nr:hypothetical protein [Nitrospira sp.]